MSSNKKAEWDPLDPDVLDQQAVAYDRMRERCPVAHSAFMGWSLFRHADIVAVLSDTASFSNASPFPAIPNGMDPPEHGHYRAALDCHFSAEALERYQPALEIIAADQLNPLLAAGCADYIAAFAAPFMMKSQCAVLGWPQEQWQQLSQWTQANASAALRQDDEAGKELAATFTDLVRGNLERERDMVSGSANAMTVLMQTQVEDKPLTDEQIVTLLRNWVAGQGTTVAAAGIVVERLAEDTALQNQLRQFPDRIPAAIEEILRHEGPLVANRRTVTREVTIAGQDFQAGDKLSLMWIAANRDPAVFDEPDSVNLERDTSQSLVWGQGIHVCQGAPLARLQLRLALEELLARTGQFHLASGRPPRAMYPSNGPAQLRLRFS